MQGAHQGKSLRLWLAVAASSLLYAAAHPPWSLWPLALVATAPVSAVLLDPRGRIPSGVAAVAGAGFGCLATWLVVAWWSYLAASDFFPGSPVTAAAFTFALPVIASGIAFYYALCFAFVARLAGLGATAGVIGSAALWAAAELARTSLLYGNPWASFAAGLVAADSALSGFRAETPVGDLLGFGGPSLVAFAASAVGASLGLAWVQRTDAVARGRALAAGAAVVALAWAAASASRQLAPARSDAAVPAAPLRVAVVQTAIGGSRLWQGAGAAESFDRHVEITRSFETKGADLIVWPESSLPFLLDANADKRDALKTLARERGAALLVGGSRSSQGPGGATSIYNSVFLFPADGSDPVAYDKRVLMPFVEHVPSWASPFLASAWQGAYASGNPAVSPDLFTVKGWRIAPLVCLESIYPGVVAARAESGADLLVNLSNDSWFDGGAGPEQHFALAMLAASETRRPLLRVATTGVSALVGEEGLVSWRLPVRTAAVALLDVVPPRHDSLFVRGGRRGVTLFLVVLAAAAVLLPFRVRNDSAAPGRGPGEPT